MALSIEWRAFSKVGERGCAILWPQPAGGWLVWPLRAFGASFFPLSAMNPGLVKACRSRFARTRLGRPCACPAQAATAVASRPYPNRPHQQGHVLREPVPSTGLPLAEGPRKQFRSLPYPFPSGGPAVPGPPVGSGRADPATPPHQMIALGSMEVEPARRAARWQDLSTQLEVCGRAGHGLAPGVVGGAEAAGDHAMPGVGRPSPAGLLRPDGAGASGYPRGPYSA